MQNTTRGCKAKSQGTTKACKTEGSTRACAVEGKQGQAGATKTNTTHMGGTKAEAKQQTTQNKQQTTKGKQPGGQTRAKTGGRQTTTKG